MTARAMDAENARMPFVNSLGTLGRVNSAAFSRAYLQRIIGLTPGQAEGEASFELRALRRGARDYQGLAEDITAITRINPSGEDIVFLASKEPAVRHALISTQGSASIINALRYSKSAPVQMVVTEQEPAEA